MSDSRRTVLITGSSSGIGYATTKHFQKQGWNVAATMRTPEKAAGLASLERVKVLTLDVTKPQTIHTAVNQAIRELGSLDVVINSAGYETQGPFEAATFKQIQRQFDTNLFGVFRVTQAVLPQLRKQGHGVIVNISSVGGRVAYPFASLYHSTKFALEGFSESLSYELELLGIRVILIEPGTVDTPFNSPERTEYLAGPDSAPYQPMIDKMIAAFTSGKLTVEFSSPEAIAEVIYKASTDTGGQLRYLAGRGAASLVEAHSRDFDGFRNNILKSFFAES